MEKFLFSKIEVWVVLLLAVFGLISMLFFGAMVRHVGAGRNKLGSVGDAVYGIAGVPEAMVDVLRGRATQKDFSSDFDVRAFPHAEYEELAGFDNPAYEHRPVIWRAEGLQTEPLAVMVRMNKAQSDEVLVILDSAREMAAHFPLTAPSLSGQFVSRTGNAAPLMLDDGSVILFSGGSDGLYRKSLCNETIWELPGLYHHSISVADGTLGILGLPKTELTAEDQGDRRWNHSEIINLIDVEDGKIIRSITLNQIVRANIAVFDPFLSNHWIAGMTEDEVLLEDYVHLNKVEILPEALADEYPDFPAGAIMLSSRAINMIAIVDPETLQILWYSHGHTQGQHDPEFIGDNKILIFDNRRDTNLDDPTDPANFSEIRQYDFSTDAWSVIWNGADVSGYTKHSGELDFRDDGTLLVDLTVQGRYLEVAPDGRVLMDLVNVGDEGSVYWAKHAQYLTPEQYEIARSTSCDS